MRIAARAACESRPRTKLDAIEPDSAEITGVVENLVRTGAVGARQFVFSPVWDALVTASETPGTAELQPRSAHQSTFTRTGEDGSFVLAIREPGRYAITVRDDGYADFIVEDVEVRQGQRTTIQWHIPLFDCPSYSGCKPNKEFGPFMCW